MNLDQTPLLSIPFVVAYFSFVIGWVLFVQPRLRVWIRGKLSEYWGVKIVERIRYRNISWDIQGPHSRRQGFLANLALMVTDFGCMVGPIFAALAGLVLLMMMLSGD